MIHNFRIERRYSVFSIIGNNLITGFQTSKFVGLMLFVRGLVYREPIKFVTRIVLPTAEACLPVGS